MQKPALYTAAVIFAAVSLAHWVRYFLGWEMSVGGSVIPLTLFPLGRRHHRRARRMDGRGNPPALNGGVNSGTPRRASNVASRRWPWAPPCAMMAGPRWETGRDRPRKNV